MIDNIERRDLFESLDKIDDNYIKEDIDSVDTDLEYLVNACIREAEGNGVVSPAGIAVYTEDGDVVIDCASHSDIKPCLNIIESILAMDTNLKANVYGNKIFIEERLEEDIEETEDEVTYYVMSVADDGSDKMRNICSEKEDAINVAMEMSTWGTFNKVKVVKDYYDVVNDEYKKEVIWESGEIAESCEKKCVICGQCYTGYGNNAAPVAEGQCCDECNLNTVIPARFKSLKD